MSILSGGHVDDFQMHIKPKTKIYFFENKFLNICDDKGQTLDNSQLKLVTTNNFNNFHWSEDL